jgi:hypothetical protein
VPIEPAQEFLSKLVLIIVHEMAIAAIMAAMARAIMTAVKTEDWPIPAFEVIGLLSPGF